jgi:cob(I)alamin adenosyltransferase
MKDGLLVVLPAPARKDTSAVGMAVRAAGNGQKVCFIQFIKGSRKTARSRRWNP